MPPPAATPDLGAAIPPIAVAPVAANSPVMGAPPDNNDNAGGNL